MPPEIAQAVIAGVVILWAILQFITNQRLSELSGQVNRLLDQRMQQLFRAREAVITYHKASIRLIHYYQQDNSHDESYVINHAELSSAEAELVGLATVINDPKLIDLTYSPNRFFDKTSDPTKTELEILLRSQSLHARINELLEENVRKRLK